MPAMTMREVDQREHRKVCGTFHVRERDTNLGGRGVGCARLVPLSLSLHTGGLVWLLLVLLLRAQLRGSVFRLGSLCDGMYNTLGSTQSRDPRVKKMHTVYHSAGHASIVLVVSTYVHYYVQMRNMTQRCTKTRKLLSVKRESRFSALRMHMLMHEPPAFFWRKGRCRRAVVYFLAKRENTPFHRRWGSCKWNLLTMVYASCACARGCGIRASASSSSSLR